MSVDEKHSNVPQRCQPSAHAWQTFPCADVQLAHTYTSSVYAGALSCRNSILALQVDNGDMQVRHSVKQWIVPPLCKCYK